MSSFAEEKVPSLTFISLFKLTIRGSLSSFYTCFYGTSSVNLTSFLSSYTLNFSSLRFPLLFINFLYNVDLQPGVHVRLSSSVGSTYQPSAIATILQHIKNWRFLCRFQEEITCREREVHTLWIFKAPSQYLFPH